MSALAVGTILRLRDIEDPDDPYNTIVVRGHFSLGRGNADVSFSPLEGFHPVQVAPAMGAGSLLRFYDVVGEIGPTSDGPWETPIEEIR